MSNNIITTDLQASHVDSAFVTLFELSLSPGTTLFFHSGVEEDLSNLKFHPLNAPASNTELLANEYTAIPIEISGIEHASEGASNRPSLSVANVGPLFRSLLQDERFSFKDLIGKRIIIRRTLEKYLVGNSEEAAPFELPTQAFYIDRVASESPIAVVFELVAPYDVSGIEIPNRTVVGKFCSWIYQGAENLDHGGCTWPNDSVIYHGNQQAQIYFNLDDNPLVSETTFNSVATAWVAGTYSIDDFVTYSGRRYRSNGLNNTEIPGTGSLWTEVFVWLPWDSGTSYTIDSVNFELSDLVRYNTYIWRALFPNTNQTPFAGSVYWTRIDYCGKTLSACKSRFQFQRAGGTTMPSALKETDKILPFGAYPGTTKFK